MFSQLFGKYLVDNGTISGEDYKKAIEGQKAVRVKLGTIAVADGILTERQVEEIHEQQLQTDKRFGDIAVEKGMLQPEQVGGLLKKQGNPYMQFLQALLESCNVPIDQVDRQLTAFQKEKGFSNQEMEALKCDDIDSLVPIFAFSPKPFVTELVGLFLRNITRFITTDYYFEKMSRVENYSYSHMAGQKLVGDHTIQIAFAEGPDNGAFKFMGSAFAEDEFEKVDANIYDAVSEFVNCNSGLFASALSREGIDLDMEPTFAYENQQVKGRVYDMPIYLEGKRLDLILTVNEEQELGQELYLYQLKEERTVTVSGDSRGSILVVDDSALSRRMLCSILEKGNYTVVCEAANGEEAVEAYQEHHPDLVTLDITMPKMDGIEALKKIRALDNKAKVIMVTAAGQQQKIVEALKCGAEQFVMKPLDEKEVLKSVEKVLSK